MFCQESLGEIKCGAFLKRARPQILSIQSADYLINGLLIVWLQKISLPPPRRGGGGSEPQKIPEGRGGWMIKTTFQGVYFELSTKIAPY